MRMGVCGLIVGVEVCEDVQIMCAIMSITLYRYLDVRPEPYRHRAIDIQISRV